MKLISNDQYAQEVYQETLSELTPSTKERVKSQLMRIFSKWQLECGVYPPGPSKILRALQDIGFSERSPDPILYKFYRLSNPDVDLSDIKPWNCCDDVITAVDLFDKISADNYPPLMDYIGRKSSPRLDRIFAVVILIAIEHDVKPNFSNFTRAAQKLIPMRLSLEKDTIENEKKRKFAQVRKQNDKRLKTRSAVFAARERLIKQSGSKKVLNKTIAHELKISESQVSRILNG